MNSNKELLLSSWKAVHQSKQGRKFLIANVDAYTFRKQGEHYVLFNQSLKTKKQPTEIGRKVSIPFENEKGYNKIIRLQILFHVDLEKNTLQPKTEAYLKQSSEDSLEIIPAEHQQDSIITINRTPIAPYHCLITWHLSRKLPQVADAQIMRVHLEIFKIFPGIKMGYNCVGVGSINHLHFHLLYSEEMIGTSKLPIETYQQKPWLKSSLINPHEQINLYSVGVVVNEITEQGVFALVLRPYQKPGEKLELAEVTNSLSFVFGIVANELIELNLPHTLLISDDGQSIYVCVREFSTLTNRYGWLEFTGVIPSFDQKGFEIKEEEIIAKKKELAVDTKSLELLKSNIKKHLSKFT